MKRIIGLLTALMLFVSIACAEPMVGGWTNVPAVEVTLPDDAKVAFDKAVEGQDDTFIPVAILSEQLVAGTNYCILCQITTPDGATSWSLVYIYADLEGKAEIMNTWEIYVDRHSQPKEN